jgi:hypothetical protein
VKYQWKILARDIGIIFLATFIGGFVNGFLRGLSVENPYLTGAIYVVAGTIGFFIVAQKNERNRFEHLGAVAFASWLLGCFNLLLGQPVSSWLSSSATLAYSMILGGWLASVVSRKQRVTSPVVPSQ